jgi:F-type H+-transporting ATPase subunit b
MARVVLVGALLLAASAAFAAGGGHGGGHGAPHVAHGWGRGQDYATAPARGWMLVTFFTVFGGLVFLLRKPLLVHLENRSDLVKKAIEEARRAKEAAEARAREAEQKLRELDGEITKLKAEFEAQGNAEAERMEKLAHDTAARIQKDAEDTIAAEQERARQVLRAEAARLALELAEERIKGALGAGDDARLQKALIDHLQKGGSAQA